MKIALNLESAEALRSFAQAIPVAVENITTETDKLIQVYNSSAETLGVHSEDFQTMILLIKKAQTDAADAIKILPAMMESTATQIINYVTKKTATSGE